MATQDMSSNLGSRRHDEYLFVRAKTTGLGQVTTKRNNEEEKNVYY